MKELWIKMNSHWHPIAKVAQNPEGLEWIYSDLGFSISAILIVTFLIYRIVSLLITGVLNENIGLIYQGKFYERGSKKSGFDVFEWSGFEELFVGLFVIDIFVVGFLGGCFLPFIIYGLLWIWPIYIFIGLLFLIKWWRNYERPIKQPKPIDETERYKRELLTKFE